MLKQATKRVLALATAAALGGFALSAGRSTMSLPDPADRPDLTGQWQLNRDKSDDPQKKLQGAKGGGWNAPRGGMGGGIGGVHGGFGGLPSPSGRGGLEEPPATREALRAVTEAPEKLTIVYRDAFVVLTSGEGQVQTLQPDGNTIKETTGGGQEVERKTKWDGSNLVSEIKMSGDVKITQTYSRSPDGRQLIVTSRFEGPARVVDIRRVYDAASEPAKTSTSNPIASLSQDRRLDLQARPAVTARNRVG